MKTRQQGKVNGKLTPFLARAALCCVLGCGIATPLMVQAESGSGSNSGSDSNSGSGSNKGSAVEGRRKFLELNCYGCHGGRGGGGMGPNIRDDRPNDNRIEDAIRNGRPTGMPSYRGLVSSQDIENLTAYIRSLRRDEEPVFTHWWERVPTQ
jgi:mono/diheme cytochrome c family protein